MWTWKTNIDYLGNRNTPKGISAQNAKIEKFLGQIRLPNTLKQVKRLIGFVHFSRKFIPNLRQNFLPFYKLVRSENVFTITNDHLLSISNLNADLTRATDITFPLAKPGLQYVILCDASFHGTGFVLMVEGYFIDQKGKTKKTYAPVCFSSRLFTTTQLEISVYQKDL